MTSHAGAPDTHIVLAIGCLILVVGLVVRGWQSWQWRRCLVALSLRLPHGLSVEDIAVWLGMVHSHTTAGRWRLIAGPPVVVEVSATRHGIRHVLLVPEVMRAGVLAALQASFPGIRAEDAPDYLTGRKRLLLAVEVRLSTFRRPLAIERATATATAFLAALQPLYGSEEIRVQWILSGAATPTVIRLPRNTGQAGLPWWLDSQAPPDADDIRAQRAKHKDLLLSFRKASIWWSSSTWMPATAMS